MGGRLRLHGWAKQRYHQTYDSSSGVSRMLKRDSETERSYFTHVYNGLGRAIGLVCLRVWTISFEIYDFLPRYLARLFILTLSLAYAKIKVIGQMFVVCHRSKLLHTLSLRTRLRAFLLQSEFGIFSVNNFFQVCSRDHAQNSLNILMSFTIEFCYACQYIFIHKSVVFFTSHTEDRFVSGLNYDVCRRGSEIETRRQEMTRRQVGLCSFRVRSRFVILSCLKIYLLLINLFPTFCHCRLLIRRCLASSRHQILHTQTTKMILTPLLRNA